MTHLVQVEVADPDRAHLAGPNRPDELGQKIIHPILGHRIVHLIEVDTVDPQPPQALIQRGHDMRRCGAIRVVEEDRG